MSGLQKHLELLTPGKNEGSVGMLVRKALIDRNVYFYGQLCNNEVVVSTIGPQSSAAAESKTIFNVLKLVTYGVWKDLDTAAPEVAKFIKESRDLTNKLRALTLLTVAETNKNISYDLLERELGIVPAAGNSNNNNSEDSASSSATFATAKAGTSEAARILEDIVIDATTIGLLTVTLNPQRRIVQVHDAAARDVNLDEVPRLLELFKAWGKRCHEVVGQLQKAQQDVARAEKEDTMRIFQLATTEDNERRKALRKVVENGTKMRDML